MVRRVIDMADTIQRDLGNMEAQLATLNREMRELKDDVRQIREDFAQVKGGWRTLIGIAAILGGAVSWVANHFMSR
jgi:chromosome condensin MukBEF ATPase and DNA-binding subunit MukB